MQPKTAPAANTPKEIGKPFNPGVQIARIRYSPDGNTLCAAAFDSSVKRWDASTNEPAELPPITGHNGWVSDIAATHSTFFSVDSWGRLTATDIAAKEPKTLWTVEAAHNGWARAIAVSADGSQLATCGKDGFIRLWNPKDGKKLGELDIKYDLLSIAFSPKGTSVLAGDLFGLVRECDISAGKVLRTYEAKELHHIDRVQDVGGVKCLMLSTDGKILFAAGGEPKTGGFVQATPLLIAFDRESGKRLGQFKGTKDSEGYVTDMAWHPEGFVIGSTSGQPGQGKFFFWKPGAADASFLGGKLPNCHSVALHPSGTKVAVSATNANSSGNGRVKGTGGDYPANSSPIQVWSVPQSPAG